MSKPINGAISTNIGFAATVASMYVALFRLRDGRAALSQSTILPWLVLATATANLWRPGTATSATLLGHS